MADTFGIVLRGIAVIVVVMVLTTIAAGSFKDLTFAEDEWEELTDSLGAFNAETIIDPLEEPGFPGDQNPEDKPEPGESSVQWWQPAVDWLANEAPIISSIIQATVSVAQAIWSGVLLIANFLQKGLDAVIALTRFLFVITTFDIPALNAHPLLQMVRVLLALPVWVGIPYLVVRMIRGGG